MDVHALKCCHPAGAVLCTEQCLQGQTDLLTSSQLSQPFFQRRPASILSAKQTAIVGIRCYDCKHTEGRSHFRANEPLNYSPDTDSGHGRGLIRLKRTNVGHGIFTSGFQVIPKGKILGTVKRF